MPQKTSKIHPVVAALMIGRGGSSLPDKNILPIHGVPLLLFAANAARRSRFISRFYTSSDCPKILSTAQRAGYKPIVRPAELSAPTSQSVDAVNHALVIIEKDGPVDILVVQHANVGTITETMIDDCIRMLIEDPSLSAVVPCHEKPEYHPYRAKTVTSDGLLEPFFDFRGKAISGNRQDLPPSLFFDHSIWALSVEHGIKAPGGQPPWSCMGERIKPYVTKDCFDVHDLGDLAKTEEWIKRNNVPIPVY